mmetsp:Transcript_53328/g.79247  ORF Transcript_53328/g.79247 Transcript_53328/m.79247 type:complete len:168 (+) Transcript_53328:142-645(+)|eukprot:CAMPEP_0195520472 /NCGR_PEP_ID=MMETSP0794_2-20130614/16987_1 /TAXON_ID=515487 /ORGANISM="Stephanopyxis turris, Strain CCMP 815" /LENGTH=167 /DNA_ID=CAMNT_0040649843 /DNA_START=133 /DNA_END=636 /DNA_ORIENTATION=-
MSTPQTSRISIKPALKPECDQHFQEKREIDKSQSDRHLTWDEPAIAEHDLTRGTRMTIDEPKTPFSEYNEHHDDDASSVTSADAKNYRSPENMSSKHNIAMQWEGLEQKLLVAKEERERLGSDAGLHPDELEKKKHEQFEKSRKQHYNEYEMMKKYRMEMEDSDDEE